MAFVLTNPNIFTRFQSGSFETAPLNVAHYVLYSGGTNKAFESSATQSFIGSRSLRYNVNDITDQQLFNLAFNPGPGIVLGRKYRYKFRIYINNWQSDAGGATLLMRVKNPANFGGTWLDIQVADENTPKGQWIQVDTGILDTQQTGISPGIVVFRLSTNDGGASDFNQTFQIYIDEFIIEEYQDVPDLTASFVKLDVSSSGGTDGTITVTVDTGTGDYSYLWLDGPITKDRSGLIAGNYEVTITDNITLQQVVLNVTITEPDPIPEPRPKEPFFDVPKTQSLQFVVEQATDGCVAFQTADNKLLRNQEGYFFKGLDYCQKKAQCDAFSIQFRSNFESHTAKLFDADDNAEVATYTPVVTVSNLGQYDTFNIRLQNHGSGQTRIYFIGFQQLPIPINVNDLIEIFNNADGFNGPYAVVGIGIDAVVSQQYLVINFAYTIIPNSSIGDIRLLNEVLDFDIYEFPIDFSVITPGCYYMTIVADNTDPILSVTATSEPIYIAADHPYTHKIEFTNIDNAFDVDFQNNIVHSVRVESVFFKRLPTSDSTNIRNSNGSLELLAAKPRRRFNLEFIMLPPYLHELLSLAFQHDVVKVNGVAVETDEQLNEPDYIERFALANSNIIVEQKEWFSTYNGDDLGGLTLEGGFILANNGFIKR